MLETMLPDRAARVLKAGGPPALITAGFGVGATGVAGPGIEARTDPLAAGLAEAIGLGAGLGPALLLGLSVLILVVAVFVPGLFEETRY